MPAALLIKTIRKYQSRAACSRSRDLGDKNLDGLVLAIDTNPDLPGPTGDGALARDRRQRKVLSGFQAQ